MVLDTWQTPRARFATRGPIAPCERRGQLRCHPPCPRVFQRPSLGLGLAGAGDSTASTALLAVPVGVFISAARTDRRSRLALTPWGIATAGMDMPSCMQVATAPAVNSSL